MTKKDFIGKIRKDFKTIREYTHESVTYVFVNGMFFEFDRVKLKFRDDNETLFIFNHEKSRIVCSIGYDLIKSIGTFNRNF